MVGFAEQLHHKIHSLKHLCEKSATSKHPGEAASYKTVTRCFKGVTCLHSAHDMDALE